MNMFLVFAGVLSAITAALHIGCIIFGGSWYRFFGAGEQMAVLSERGSVEPTVITSVIVLIFSIWALYAFSAAGLVGKLPFTRTALIVITVIYFSRGLVGLFFINNPIGRSPKFWLWSSVICLLIGVIHFIGLKQQWSSL
ncbi:hypothetical protein [Psychrobacter sp. DAB_AL43B]|uniref:hypothetical protein n=1 Tax=Psychrobacter sp. DAB_AL43B TaxID=1028416 RepID=UPI0009A82B55|nr:hypothetical protein [Psychrobacter sp. DAB_AL43B]SLJ84370.1 hypothetical protein DABAL43B_1173 [Psychrobacter sp. DAB_AL43B]